MENTSLTFKLLDVLDKKTLQNIQDSFSKATGMAALTIDVDGAPITELSSARDFCVKYTRGSKLGLERCLKCDIDAGQQAGRTGRPIIYNCHAGLVDFTCPIIVKGRQLGSMLGGQVIPQEPDEEKFIKLAKELNIDPNKYIEALRKVTIMPKSKIESAAELLFVVVNTLSKSIHEQIVVQELSQKIMVGVDELTSNVKKISSLIDSNSEKLSNIMEITDEIDTVSQKELEQVNKIKGITSDMKNISTQITILGFNASVEAARAKGNSAAGFQIIAQEIRRLAETYKKSAEIIESVFSEIEIFSNRLDLGSAKSRKVVEESIKATEDAKGFLGELLKTADELKHNS